MLGLFLHPLRHQLGEGAIGVVLDSSGCHRSGQGNWPQDMHPLYLPASSPELNPAEQIFRPLRKQFSNVVFTTLDAWQNALIDELRQFWEHPTVLLQLMCSPFRLRLCSQRLDEHTMDLYVVAPEGSTVASRVHAAVLICVKTAAILGAVLALGPFKEEDYMRLVKLSVERKDHLVGLNGCEHSWPYCGQASDHLP